MPIDLILVGRIGAAHGVRGQVSLESFMQDPGTLGRSGYLVDASGQTKFDIVLVRHLKANRFIAEIAGVRSRAEAEALRNVCLYLDRDRLPTPAPDEFYYADLIGMRVEDFAHGLIGSVVAVLDFGAGDILQITRSDGSELLLPFTRKVVGMVDSGRKRLVVDLPVETNGESNQAS